MKKNDIIELNGKEYTVELNRQSYIAIDKYSNIQNTANKIAENLYDYADEKEISKDEDPFSNTPSIEESIEAVDKKMELLKKLYVRAFWIWLYPNHKLSIDDVSELLNDYFDDDDKFGYLSDKYGEFIKGSIDIKIQAEEEIKNLKALANK